AQLDHQQSPHGDRLHPLRSARTRAAGTATRMEPDERLEPERHAPPGQARPARTTPCRRSTTYLRALSGTEEVGLNPYGLLRRTRRSEPSGKGLGPPLQFRIAR